MQDQGIRQCLSGLAASPGLALLCLAQTACPKSKGAERSWATLTQRALKLCA